MLLAIPIQIVIVIFIFLLVGFIVAAALFYAGQKKTVEKQQDMIKPEDNHQQ